METLGCIKTRTSIRKYRPDPVPEDLIKKILEAAVQAPSAGNVQEWEFIVVKDLTNKKKLAEAAFDQDFVAKAAVVVVVCSDLNKISDAYGVRGISLYSIQNASAAIQNMLLAANDFGLGTCWVGAFNEESVKGILVLPESVRPLAIITLGYPAEKPEKSERVSIKEKTHFEKW